MAAYIKIRMNLCKHVKQNLHLKSFFPGNGILSTIINGFYNDQRRNLASGLPGSGAGRGGGSGGTVRESGGSLGEYAAAQEESYFFKKQKEQLKNIKKKLESSEALELSQKDKNEK